ncbi:MAG: hypothetical protein MR609_07355 [Bacteroidales bacterium]|nr:hypothetical protein [Bacteroidales bacterium]
MSKANAQVTSAEIQTFFNADFGEIRTTGTQDHPFFSLTDVCKAIGLDQPSRVRTRLSTPGVITIKVGVVTGTKADGTPAIQTVEMTFIDEPNLYRCVFQSRKPEAEKFQDWIFSEVLPSIRKTGRYTPKAAPGGYPDFTDMPNGKKVWEFAQSITELVVHLAATQGALQARTGERDSALADLEDARRALAAAPASDLEEENKRLEARVSELEKDLVEQSELLRKYEEKYKSGEVKRRLADIRREISALQNML